LWKLYPDVQYPRLGLIPLFGGALDLQGSLAVISESNSEVVRDSFAIGGAYVFDMQTGEQLLKLSSPVPFDTHDGFGASIEIDGSKVIIGASGINDACPGHGC
jgi:hypothetical protein